MGAIFLTPYGGVPVTPKLGLEKNHLILTLATYPETMKAPLKNAATRTIDPLLQNFFIETRGRVFKTRKIA